MIHSSASIALIGSIFVIISLLPEQVETTSVLLQPFPDDGALKFSDCPVWLRDYAAFHRSNRGNPKARYLVFVGIKQGIGDTLRGLKYTLKLAAATNRVLLIRDRKTSGLTVGHLLLPNIIDWTYDPAALGLMEEDLRGRVVDITYHDRNNTGDLTVLASEQRVVSMRSGMLEMAAELLPLPPSSHLNASAFDTDAAWCLNCSYRLKEMIGSCCSLRALFKASGGLEADYARTMKAVFNPTKPGAYIAVHLRLGGIQGGKENNIVQKRVSGDDAFKNRRVMLVLRTLVCARKAAKEHGSTAPILLLTDNEKLRRLVQHGRFGAHVVSTPFEAVHLSWQKAVTEDDTALARSVYVDMMLMAGSKCLFAPVRSGFNHQARLWGGVECFNPYEGCTELSEKQIVDDFFGF